MSRETYKRTHTWTPKNEQNEYSTADKREKQVKLQENTWFNKQTNKQINKQTESETKTPVCKHSYQLKMFGMCPLYVGYSMVFYCCICGRRRGTIRLYFKASGEKRQKTKQREKLPKRATRTKWNKNLFQLIRNVCCQRPGFAWIFPYLFEAHHDTHMDGNVRIILAHVNRMHNTYFRMVNEQHLVCFQRKGKR